MKQKKSSEDRICGNCIWWEYGFCDIKLNYKREDDNCDKWMDKKNPKYKEDK